MQSFRESFRRWQSECYFTAVPVPSFVSPLAAVNNGLDSVRALRLTSPIVKKSAMTACQQARQACRHVDIATGSNTTTSWPTMRQYQQPYYLPPPTPRPQNVLDMLSPEQLSALMASQQTRDAAAIASNIDATAAASRAIQAASEVKA